MKTESGVGCGMETNNSPTAATKSISTKHPNGNVPTMQSGNSYTWVAKEHGSKRGAHSSQTGVSIPENKNGAHSNQQAHTAA